jgi:hypothetical protein
VSTSVSQHLEQQHGVRISPGRKGVCPFCRHETFSVRKDDSVGKCFHPTCGRAVSSGSLRGDYQGSLYQILDVIKRDCHEYLVNQIKTKKGFAYHYLNECRGIGTRVLFDLVELGAVPPRYPIDVVFRGPLDGVTARINELEAKICASQQRRLEAKEGRQQEHRDGRQKGPASAKSKTDDEKAWEKEIGRLQRERNWLEENRSTLSERLAVTVDWVAFFHTDQYHRVRSVRFRKADSLAKSFQSYVPFGSASGDIETGLFGHSLFQPYTAEDKQQCNRLLICEGEINLLQVHSLAVRTAGAVEGRFGPYYANWLAATGSATTVDIKTIAELLDTPGAVKPLVLIQDNDEAGDRMVAQLCARFTLEVVTPPTRGQDIDDYIRAFGQDYAAALAGLQELISERRRIHRPWCALAAQIFRTRQKHGEGDERREFEINLAVKEIVVKDLCERGQFYHDGPLGYYFLTDEKRLIALDDADKELSCLLDRYGLNAVEKTCEYVQEALHIESISRGQATRVHRLAWFDPVEYKLYLYNHANGIYRITAEAIELVDNGTDGVLFLCDARNEPFELVPDEDLGDLFHETVAARVNFDPDARLSVPEQQALLDLWFLSLFFGSLLPTRAHLAIVGPKGSGKSYTLRAIGLILFGPRFEVQSLPDKEDAFDAVVTSAYYAAFDNADSRVKWLPDRLAICATGGTVSKRQLYTTNTMVSFPINCFLGITSRTPHFNRDDVADRLLLLRVHRFAEGQYLSESALKDTVMRQRAHILTAVVRHLQEAIAALRATHGREYRTSFRMADFATFALRLADAEGDCKVVEGIFAKLQEEQSAFALEDDELIALLLAWLEDVNNQGREVKAAELWKDLSALAKKTDRKLPVNCGRGLGQRLGHIEVNLKSVVALEIVRDAHAKQKRYKFWPLDAEVRESRESHKNDSASDSADANA